MNSSVQLSEQNDLAHQVALITTMWKESLTASTSQLFDGSVNSTGTLFRYIFQGACFQAPRNQPALALQKFTERALYPLLINHAWSLGKQAVFVADAEYACKDDSDIPPNSVEEGLSNSLYVCFKGAGYWLAIIKAGQSSCGKGGCQPTHTFGSPDGTDSLGDYNLNTRDFVIG